MRQISFKLTILLAVVAIFSCSDPALIGSELLTEDQANLKFSDNISIKGKTVNGGIVQTYSPFTALQLERHLVGNYEDPLFGRSEASIYTQIALGSQAPPTDLPQFDSIVLSLAYDTLNGGYGDLNQVFGLEVLLLEEEEMVNINDYFSDKTFQTNPVPIGSVEFTPAPNDVVLINSYSKDSLILDTVLAHVRIPLEGSFGQMLLRDTALFRNDTLLQKFFKGMQIRATIASPGMLSFDFTQDISRISLYYTSGKPAQQKEYRFDFNPSNARVINFSHNYEGSLVEEALKNESDSLVFVQGMAGVNTELSFPDISNLQNIVVNKAELELTVASFDGGNEIFTPSKQIIITSGDVGARSIIVDVQSALFAQNPIRTDIFGGIPVLTTQDGVTLTKYKINISGHFQKILDKEVENTLILSSGIEQTRWYFQITPKAVDPSRVIFYGPNHPLYPLKLNLTYTEL